MNVISFIIPAYNAEKTIRDCIESIIRQDIPDYKKEIIVVDNNSTDSTQQIAEQYAEVKILFREVRSRSGARQSGVDYSTGTLIAFVDSDVILDAEWATKLINFINQYPQLGAVQGSVIPEVEKSWHWLRWHRSRIKTNGTFIHLSASRTGIIPVINTAASLWKRKALADGFDLKIQRAEDIDLTMKVLYRGYSLGGMTSARARVRWSDSLLTWLKRFYEQGFSEKIIYKKWGYEFPELSYSGMFYHPLWTSLPLFSQLLEILILTYFRIGSRREVKESISEIPVLIKAPQLFYKVFQEDKYFLRPHSRTIILDDKVAILNLENKRCIWVSRDEKKWNKNLAIGLVRDNFLLARSE